MASRTADVLILCKTYPSPSAKHVETSCVAGMDINGELVRLFPIPFRVLEGERQFKKWQWIRARIEKAKGDNRPESNKVFFDTIQRRGEPLDTRYEWRDRRQAIKHIEVHDSFESVERARTETGETLDLLRPA